MIINEFWLVIITMMIYTEIYLLSKYISDRNNIFVDNRYGSFVNGIIFYLFITFLTFLPFIWLNVNISYIVIVFWIKEGLTILILITREEKYYEKLITKEYILVIIGAIITTIIWNYGISKIINPVEEERNNNFSTIFTFNDVISKITNMNLETVKQWVTTTIVSTIALGSVLATMKEYSYHMNYLSKFSGLIITLFSIILFSYKLPLWQNAETFIALFLLLICTRVILYSRRRYGIMFAISSVVSLTFGEHLRIALWAMAIVTMVVYTFMKKQQNSLFWVMLISPLLILESFNVYEISGVLSIVLVSFSVILFTFMLSLQGVKPLKKLNKFFEKYRIVVPMILMTIILITSITIIFTKNIDWNSLPSINNSISYLLYDNDIYKWITFSISIFITLTLTLYVFSKLFLKRKLERKDYVYVISLLLILVVFNPVMNAMYSISFFKENIKYISSCVYLPVFILISNENIKLINKK